MPGDQQGTDDDPPPLARRSTSEKAQEKTKKKRSPLRFEATPNPGEAKNGPARPTLDADVVQAQATAPGAGGSGREGGGDAPLSTSERLPLGKQTVSVTVDVQAPATMNITKQATLKLIVRNTGVSDAFNVRVDDELPEGLKFISSQPEMRVIPRRPPLELAAQSATRRV